VTDSEEGVAFMGKLGGDLVRLWLAWLEADRNAVVSEDVLMELKKHDLEQLNCIHRDPATKVKLPSSCM
jgi:hypothetical protein